MSDHPKVAIFWDYENCSPPSNSCGLGYGIVNNIGRVARIFGSVTTFRAYLDISTQSSKSVLLRSELQSSGVSMIDCPHNGKKDVVDKMLLVDMLAFAVDHPAPATIILITGDRDYAYAVSILKLRKYQVILVVPSHTSPCLESQASLVIDWGVAVLRSRTESPNPAQPIRQPYSDLDATLVTRLLGELRETPLDNADATYSTPSRGASRLRRVTTRDLLEPYFDSAQDFTRNPVSPKRATNTGSDSASERQPIPKTPPRSRHASVSTGSARTRSTTIVTPCHPVVGQHTPAKNPPPSTATRPGTCDTTDVFDPAKRCLSVLTSPDALELPLHDNRPPSSIIIRSPLEPSQPTCDMPGMLGEPGSFPHESECLASPFVMTTALTGLQSVPNHMTVKPTSSSVATMKSLPETAASVFATSQAEDIDVPKEIDYLTSLHTESNVGAEQSNPHRVHSEASYNLPDLANSNDHAFAALHTTHSLSGKNAGLHTPASKHVSLPAAGFLGANDGIDCAQFPAFLCASDRDRATPTSVSASSSASLSTPSTTAESDIHDDDTERCQTWIVFKPLIRLLLAARVRGVVHPSRSTVALDLVKSDNQVYQRAGVSRFRDYTALAEKAGIIELGGKDADAWIALHPNWFGVDGITTTQILSNSVPSPTFDSAKASHSLLTGPEAPVIEKAAIFQTPEPRSPLLKGSDICPTSPSNEQDSASQGSTPAQFQALIDTLVQIRADGSHQPRRSLVGQMLNQEVYSQAGVSGFKEYVRRASEAQVIECGGVGGFAWIQLHPELRF